MERSSVRAGVMYFAAIHADDTSLHEGINFVIDVGNQTNEKVGNEKKLQVRRRAGWGAATLIAYHLALQLTTSPSPPQQKTWQSFPLRPQRILISGAGLVKRIFINGLVRFASLFSKAKVLERIRFVTMAQVIEEFGPEAVPKYRSDKGAKGDIGDWVKSRLEGFPPPDLSSSSK